MDNETRRLNILKPIKIDKQNLRGGLANLNQRKEIGRYNNEVRQKSSIQQLCESESKVGIMSSEPEVSLDMFEPSMRHTRKRTGRGAYF